MLEGKKIYDITMKIRENMPFYPETEPVKIIKRKNFFRDGFNLTSINMNLHTGTHIDAPFHFIHEGKKTEEISLDELIVNAQVIAIEDGQEITVQELKQKEFNNSSILFKTANSKIIEENDFDENYIGMNIDAAQYMVDQGVDLIGIDYLSVGNYGQEDLKIHKLLLKNEIILLEGINLSQVKPGEYTLFALPLKIDSAEGAPVRAVLIE